MLNQLTKLIEKSKNIVFFGGAGVSAESGIPTFRGNNGLYTAEQKTEYSPEEILHIGFFASKPARFYEYYRANMIYPEAAPNAAHKALAHLEREGKLAAVITQNIDGLHQRAGSQNVIELHGSTLRNYCTRCGAQYDVEHILGGAGVPVCASCGGIVRPDVVLYGEMLPEASWRAAEMAIARADMLIVGGTSLTVQPAASLIFRYRGENLVIINRDPTPYDELAKLVIREPIGEVFGKIMKGKI